MGKIAKKKKGRPSKADLSRRTGIHGDPPPESDLNRNRRNLTYTDDFDGDEDEDERREKKLKLVLRLSHSKKAASYEGVDSVTSLTGAGRGSGNVGHASAPESRAAVSASSSEYGDGNKPIKKRRIDGDDGIYDDNGNGNDDDDDDDGRSIGSGVQKKEIGRNGDSKRVDSIPGTPVELPSGVSVPDRKQLELVLDKLQKKDTYGVYAEPVDPEELPDYHDVIEHPMDFGTIRKKLGNGAYCNLEQFESDVFLVCTNAMQYNAPETIYFKQARSIQELARKKFQRLRIEIECTEVELKPEQKTISNSVVKKPIKKSMCKTVQEPVGSDFSSGATLATVGDTCTWSNTAQAGGCERPINADGLVVDGNSSLTDNKSEKAEEQLSGKGFPSKFGRKSSLLDENRRATYNIFNQPVVRTESMFTTFESENKPLVAIGLQADHAYSRSLARFAGTLGSVAWKLASRRIEQALPVGFKFGRGWVGEYEPLPTPVLILENHTQKQLGTNLLNTTGSRKADKTVEVLKARQDDMQLGLRTLNSSAMTTSSKLLVPEKECHLSEPILEGKPGFGVAGTKPIVNAMHRQQNLITMSFGHSDKNVLKQVKLNDSARGNPIDIASCKQLEHSSEMTTLLEMVSRNRNLVQSVPFKQPETDGVGGLPNGKPVSSNSDNHKASSLSSDFVSNQQGRAANYFPHGNHDQGLNDPVQMMRMLAEKTQNQQKSSNPPRNDAQQVMSPVPSSRKDNSSAAATTAATTAAREWMSLGAAQFKNTDSSGLPKMQIAAASLYNPARERTQSVSCFREEPPVSRVLQLQSEKNRFPQAFVQQSVRVGDELQFQHKRPAVFPQLVTTDLSRFQVQSPWRGLIPHTQPNKKQDTLPPDLNIGFQSSGSPVRQSSGILVDSQQPDLALQL